jgi:signal transduction histidine kinase
MEQKQDKADMLKRMASVVSHEIRNPLAIIANSTYFVKTKLSAGGAAPDPKVSKHLGIIEGEVKRSNEVIEEMLSFTRERELSLSKISVNAVLQDLAAQYQLPPAVTLQVKTDPADPAADADAAAIGAALRHVVDNAVQALPEGGALTAEVSHDDKLVYLTVTDAGPGLPDGDGEKVFEPFFTTKPRGIGLGLTIARKYLRQQGGDAAAANVPGGGARVTLSLPLAA